jgi:phage-related protein
MKWTITYFEQEDMAQPAEVFEDVLDSTYPKLSGKLLQVTVQFQYYGHQLGGGYIEKCHDYEGIWEMRVIHSRTLAREFFGFDGERIVLLHGYIKRTGEPASVRDLKKASACWIEYMRTHRISPVQEEDHE